ncbi:uncharacterized protein PG986_004096 [Apiospora aurea]|uniref:DUF7514 domain-containing protein n=1 Tax=Apiospora aurea TaxID=335848 RepID=A0ABR1QLL6_9PEZI
MEGSVSKILGTLCPAKNTGHIDHVGDRDDKFLSRHKLAAVYKSGGLDYDSLFVNAPDKSISYARVLLGCQHSLPPGDNDFEESSVPHLSLKGFAFSTPRTTATHEAPETSGNLGYCETDAGTGLDDMAIIRPSLRNNVLLFMKSLPRGTRYLPELDNRFLKERSALRSLYAIANLLQLLDRVFATFIRAAMLYSEEVAEAVHSTHQDMARHFDTVGQREGGLNSYCQTLAEQKLSG